MAERIHWLAFDQHGDHGSACGGRYDHAVVNPMLVTCLRCKRSKAWRQPDTEPKETKR